MVEIAAKCVGRHPLTGGSTPLSSRRNVHITMFSFQNKNVKCLFFIYIFCICLILLTIIYIEQTPSRSKIVWVKEVEETWPAGVLFNLLNFTHLLTSSSCSESTFAILIVTSYAGDVETRSSLRQAYPESILTSLGIKRVFLLALIDPSKDSTVSQEAIVNENERFADIVQGNFYEHYRNLTYKHVMGLKWAAENCPRAEFVIKMDHDIIVDFFSISEMLKKLPKRDNILAGYVMSDMKPIREPVNKWYVTRDEYEADSYPDFLSGWLYITNPSTAFHLTHAAGRVPYFWIDDTYVTGLVARELGVPLVRLNSYFTTHPEHLKCCIVDHQLECDFWVGPNGGDNRLVRIFEKYAENCFRNKCTPRLQNESIRDTCNIHV